MVYSGLCLQLMECVDLNRNDVYSRNGVDTMVLIHTFSKEPV